MLLVENVMFCETTICVYASEEHSFTDVSVTRSALETFAAEDMGLTGDNIAFPEVGDFLTYLNDFSSEFMSHNHGRLDLVPDRLMPIVDVHVSATD
jgi:hypothetical protein